MKKAYKILIGLFAIAIFLAPNQKAMSILIVDNSNTNDPEYLVEEILLGGGVTVMNVMYNGNENSMGTFNYTPSMQPGIPDMGIETGLILTSGSIQNAVGPNTFSGATTDNGLPGDADLDGLIPGYQTFDATVIEFDFIPFFDNISFRYVFASEEYQEYVCSDFNDVFGFFASGPGIGNGVDPVNIALVPGTTDPVAINSVNDGCWAAWNSGPGPYDCSQLENNMYPQYYVDNDIEGSPDIEYDGMTTVFTAQLSDLQPCQVYHIKLAVGDAGDEILDSGIFLEGGSFSSIGEGTQTELTLCPGQPEQIGPAPLPGYEYEWLSVDGSPLDVFSQTDISQPIVTIENNGPEPLVYQYELTFGGCPYGLIYTLTIPPAIDFDLGEDMTLRVGETWNVILFPMGGTPCWDPDMGQTYSYGWFDEMEVLPCTTASCRSNSFEVEEWMVGQTNTITVTVYDCEGCSTQKSVTLTFESDLQTEFETCSGDPVQFGPSTIESSTFFWTSNEDPELMYLDDPFSLQPTATIINEDINGDPMDYVYTLNVDGEPMYDFTITVYAQIAFDLGGYFNMIEGETRTLRPEPAGGNPLLINDDPVYSYLWDSPHYPFADPEARQQTITVGDDMAGSHMFLTCEASDIFGCTGTNDLLITFYENRLNVCSGVPVQIGALSPDQSFSYFWNTPEGQEENLALLSDPFSPNPTFTATNGGAEPMDYYFTLIEINNDDETINAYTDFHITVQPAVGIDLGENSIDLPVGEIVEIGADAAGGVEWGSYYTYVWTSNGMFFEGNDPNEQYQTVTSPQELEGTSETFFVTATDELGCWATDEITINYVSPSEVRIVHEDIYGNQNACCPMVPVTFEGILASQDRTIVLWEWDFDDGTTATGQEAEHTYCYEGDYEVTLTATDSEGEEIETTIDLEIEYNDCPIVVQVEDKETCYGEPVNLGGAVIYCGDEEITATVIGGSGEYRIDWTPSAPLRNLYTLDPTYYRPTRDMTFQLRVQDVNTGEIGNGYVNVTVHPKPVLSVRRMQTAVIGTDVALSSLISGVIDGEAPITYYWRDQYGNEYDGDDVLENFTGSIRLYVYCEDANGCESRTYYVFLRAVRERSAEPEDYAFVDVYPNPVGNELQLQAEFFEPTDVRVKLVNLLGTEVATLTPMYSVEYIEETIPMHQLPAGVYFLQINAGEAFVVKRIVKE